MKNSIWNSIFEFILITVGAVIAAFSIEEFLVPCTILDGGIVGVSIIVNNLTGIKLGILTFLINIPFLIIGAKKLGHLFIIKSTYAMIIFSLFLGIFENFISATEEYLLAVSFGGIILGIGVGLVIRFGGCLDGTETVAILINRKFEVPVGKIVLIFNIFIYIAAAFLFGWDRAMYSLLTYFITSKVIDIIEEGIDQAKAAMIITKDATRLGKVIHERLGRTVTIIEGTGLVSGKKVILYCVLTQFEIYELKKIIEEVDESAFVTVSDISEIIGNHIKATTKSNKKGQSCN
ncbi:MAG: YitT family protein [Clostridium sp.]|uniref:YitT family protein n=1 Tax=Clostridium sp. DSM 8431 TaxID=1761781 RepID=UPI0008E67485|nr:YitT family protein [Clostridium sp. DSM 8431]MCR4944475.1 YitT family protein [Clostridium sp.]SFU83896.1 Uncharacterized membrane-anchored protein YitT, contains DUF161 and DUF2179 domains [Clostridium sp. DSM 8431]